YGFWLFWGAAGVNASCLERIGFELRNIDMSSWSGASVGAPISLLMHQAPAASSGFETAVSLVEDSAIALASKSNPGSRAAELMRGEPTTLLRPRASEEGSGFQAQSSASGASNEPRQRAIRYSAPDGIRTHAGAGLSRLPLPFGLRGPDIRGGCDLSCARVSETPPRRASSRRRSA